MKWTDAEDIAIGLYEKFPETDPLTGVANRRKATEGLGQFLRLAKRHRQPLSVALTKFIGQYDSAWQYVFAISVVAIVPVVLLFALIERRLVGGLTAGSIK